MKSNELVRALACKYCNSEMKFTLETETPTGSVHRLHCEKCSQTTKEEKFLSMMDDFSDVIAKHFPNFDNNIEDSTWAFLVLFTEETIYQLGKDKNK
jgi:hypothetical protein